MSVFGLYESTAFAKAIAKSNGIKIRQVMEPVVPSIVSRDTILIGPESLYGHEEYMEELHSELSKLFPALSPFQDLKLKKGTVGHTVQQILYQHRAEWQEHGEYKGRDRILRDRYVRRVRSSGGITKFCSDIAEKNETIAALLYADYEKRSEWQEGLSGQCPDGLRAKVDAIRPLIDELYKVRTAEELESLIRRIANVQPEKEDEEGGGGEQQGGGPGEGKPGTEQQSGGPGKGAEGGDEEGQPDGQGSTDGAGDGEGSGQGLADGEQGGGADGESSSRDADGNLGSTQGAGQDAPIDGAPKKAKGNDEEPEGEFVGCESNEDGGVGASLDKMSLVRDAHQYKERHPQDGPPYIPSNAFHIVDLTRGTRGHLGGPRLSISKLIDNSSISKSIRKYLITEKQTGFSYGLKKGRLCGRQVSRIYTGDPHPRIFKERNSTRITTDVAIFVLGDCSGSMSGVKYVTSAACQILLSETLRDLQVVHMCTMFSTDQCRLVHYITKHFDEMGVSRDTLLNRYTDCRINMNANGDGESIIWAASALAKRSEKKKLLVVLSDGAPAFGRGDDSQYLKDVVKSIEDSRVMDIVGIGILTEAVKYYYKDYRVVRRIEQLEGVIFELLRDTLKGGSR